MSLEPGSEWGRAHLIPEDLEIAGTDAEATALLAAGHQRIGLAGGDLCKTLGGRGDVGDRLGSEGVACPIDVGMVEVGDRHSYFLAHVVVRGLFGLGEGAVIMNAEWLGAYRLGPRAHPGDGLVDITSGSLSPRQLLTARARSRTGDHLPHPGLSVRRKAAIELEFPRPRVVLVDGVRFARSRSLRAALTGTTVDVFV